MSENKRKKIQKYLVMFLICSFLGIASTLIFNHVVLQTCLNDYINLAWTNYLFKTRRDINPEPNKVNNDIVVVMIDKPTLYELKIFWPIGRDDIAKIIEFLRMSGAKAVILDILFSDPKIDKPDEDAMLVESVKKSGNIYLGANFLSSENENLVEKEKSSKFAIDIYPAEKIGNEKFKLSRINLIFDVSFPALLDVTKGTGFFNSAGGKDLTREGELFICNQDNCFPNLPFAPYLDFLKTKQIKLNPEKYVLVKDHIIPIGTENRFYVNWFGGKDVFNEDQKDYNDFVYLEKPAWKLIQTYNSIQQYADKLHKTPDQIFYDWYNDINVQDIRGLKFKIDPDVFKDKIVFLGVSCASAEDYIKTPFGTMPGVYKHACVLDNLITKRFISKISFGMSVFSMFFLAFITSFNCNICLFKRKGNTDGFAAHLCNIIFFCCYCFICIL